MKNIEREKKLTLNIEDRKLFFLMSCLKEINLSYTDYKELLVVLCKNEKLSTCINFYLTNNSEVN
tara:strand:+ start:253 stop:447 length:195 start_codon:yes stop_codon:yes gene_type:complete